MRNLMVGLFRHLETTSKIYVDKRIRYTDQILGVGALKKYRKVILECKESVEGISGYQWDLVASKM